MLQVCITLPHKEPFSLRACETRSISGFSKEHKTYSCQSGEVMQSQFRSRGPQQREWHMRDTEKKKDQITLPMNPFETLWFEVLLRNLVLGALMITNTHSSHIYVFILLAICLKCRDVSITVVADCQGETKVAELLRENNSQRSPQRQGGLTHSKKRHDALHTCFVLFFLPAKREVSMLHRAWASAQKGTSCSSFKRRRRAEDKAKAHPHFQPNGKVNERPHVIPWHAAAVCQLKRNNLQFYFFLSIDLKP